MSSAAATPPVIPAPERLPPELGSTLTALWLSVACGMMAVAALWPMMLGSAPAFFPDVDQNNLANLGWMTLASVVGFILIAGLFVSYRVRRKNRGALRFLRLSLLAGMVAGLAVIGGMIFVIAQGNVTAPLGPVPVMSALALGLAGLLPFGFAIFALSYANTDAVEDYFRPEQPEEEHLGGLGGLGMMPGYRAAEAVGEAADFDQAAPAGAEEAALAPGEQTRETRVLVHGRDTMLQPETLAPPGDVPLSPDALDAMFSGREDEAVDAVAAGADPEHPGSFSDSIFDEDDMPPGPGSRRKKGDSKRIEQPETKLTGESSIFSEMNTLPGSSVISGMARDAGVPEVVLPESAKSLPPSKPAAEPPAEEKKDKEEGEQK